jgi:opacity protein-like surface antigen
MSGRYWLFLLPLIMMLAGPAHAEWYADLYGGAAFTKSYTLTQSTPGLEVAGTVKTITGVSAGGRAGYWFSRVPWYGIGLDAFYFTASNKVQQSSQTVNGVPVGMLPVGASDNRIVAVAFDVIRLRLQLLDNYLYEQGRLQPYIAAGPAIFFSHRSLNSLNPPNQAATDTSLGVKAGAGVDYRITPLVGLFGEYRFTHFHANQTGIRDQSLGPASLKSTLDTHHVIGGVSFHF